jgi:hypothetical protein
MVNPLFDMGYVTGRMSQTQPDLSHMGDLQKIVMGPPSPLKYLAAKSLAEGGEWYTWDNIEEGELIAQGPTLQEGPALALAVLPAEGGQRGTVEEVAEGIRGSNRDVNLDADVHV